MLELTIRLLDNGSVQVTGPINDLMLCYGLMEAAKDSLREHRAKQAANPIQVAHSLPG